MQYNCKLHAIINLRISLATKSISLEMTSFSSKNCSKHFNDLGMRFNYLSSVRSNMQSALEAELVFVVLVKKYGGRGDA